MSHNQRNKAIQMVEEKNIQQTHAHHGHSHLKPANVIDHLKTKVKKKRLSKADTSTISDDALSQDFNINNNNNNINNQLRSSPEHTESSTIETSLTATNTRPFISSTTFNNKSSFDEDDIEENNVNANDSIEIDEQDSIISNGIAEEPDIEENIPERISTITTDRNRKMPKHKLKPLKGTKSLPDTTNQSNVKKRRQKIRRTGFQIRDEDFKSIFSDLPANEQLIIAYPCAWRKDVFMHGRMFLSDNYLSFYTCFFKWEESVSIAFKDIVNVTREKSVKVLPNAIKLQTKNQEQYIFASYIPRERIFLAIFRIWQNALLEKPLDYQQLRALVYADQQSHDESTGDSEGSINLENATEDGAESTLLTQSLPVTLTRSKESPTRSTVNPQRVVSLLPDDETKTYLSTCPCESHLTRTFADRLFTLNVNTLFELLFSDNTFTRDFHNAQKLIDFVYGEWRVNKETGQKQRLVTYRTMTQSVLGTNELFCQEKQTLEVEKPNLIYVLTSEVNNEGMRYTDAFSVLTKFCMTQRDAEHSGLRVTAEVKYIKNVNGIVKSFIERNANSSIEGGVNEQVRRLENYQMNQNNRKASRKRTSGSKQQQQVINNNPTPQQIDRPSINLPQSKSSLKEKTITGKGIFYDMALLAGFVLLFLHIYLCYKLYSIDQAVISPNDICLNQCQKTCLENYAQK